MGGKKPVTARRRGVAAGLGYEDNVTALLGALKNEACCGSNILVQMMGGAHCGSVLSNKARS